MSLRVPDMAMIHKVKLSDVLLAFPNPDLQKILETKTWNFKIINIVNSEKFITTVSRYLRDCFDMRDGDIIEYDFIQTYQYGGHCWYNGKISLEIHHELPEIYYPKYPVNYMAPNGYFRHLHSYVWIEAQKLEDLILFEDEENGYVSVDRFRKRYRLKYPYDWREHEKTNKEGVVVVPCRVEIEDLDDDNISVYAMSASNEVSARTVDSDHTLSTIKDITPRSV